MPLDACCEVPGLAAPAVGEPSSCDCTCGGSSSSLDDSESVSLSLEVVAMDGDRERRRTSEGCLFRGANDGGLLVLGPVVLWVGVVVLWAGPSCILESCVTVLAMECGPLSFFWIPNLTRNLPRPIPMIVRFGRPYMLQASGTQTVLTPQTPLHSLLSTTMQTGRSLESI